MIKTNYIQQNHVRMRFDKCVELFNDHDFFHEFLGFSAQIFGFFKSGQSLACGPTPVQFS